MNDEVLNQIEQIISYKFSNPSLLSKAFTHTSAVDERLASNERLEFAGDAILGHIICQTLYERFPHYFEGDLTKIKSMLVSRNTCARIIRELSLQEFLKVGKGMASSKALNGSLAAGLLEAIIAAVYIDGGYEAAQKFTLKLFRQLIEKADADHSQGNYKSLLQQHSQQLLNTTPFYTLLDEKGPDHNRCFEIGVVIGENHFPSAWGTNKKEAEQKAAFNALVELGVLKQSSDEQNQDL